MAGEEPSDGTDRMGLEHDPIPEWTGGGRKPPDA